MAFRKVRTLLLETIHGFPFLLRVLRFNQKNNTYGAELKFLLNKYSYSDID